MKPGGLGLAPLAAVLITEHAPLSPTDIFAPASTPAQAIFELSVFIWATTAAIFLVVFCLLLYAVVRFRKRKDDDGREPAQVYGSTQIELAWTIIPVLVVLVGGPLPPLQRRHRERASRSGERPRAPDAHHPQAALGGHGPQLLGAPPGGKDGPHPQLHQQHVD